MLIVLASLALQQGVFEKVIPIPTGKDGYEEYVRASEIAGSQPAAAFVAWVPRKDYSKAKVDPTQREPMTQEFINTLKELLGTGEHFPLRWTIWELPCPFQCFHQSLVTPKT
ncbi:hypothetical protein BH11ARM1_BH11ARM1_12000 [soil metagenome]